MTSKKSSKIKGQSKDKKPQDKVPSYDDAFSALRALVSRPATMLHGEQFRYETQIKENDRGAAILVATAVENSLQFAISQYMKLSMNGARELFGERAPLSDFFAKILLDHRLGMYEHQTRRNLDTIRHVRNAFAHAQVPISFKESEIINLVAFMEVPEKVDRRPTALRIHDNPALQPSPDIAPARVKFQDVCAITGHNLFMYFLGAAVEIERADLRV